MSSGEIVVVGLGPGSADLLTAAARRELAGNRVFLRTRIHPTLDELPDAAGWRSFDALYEAAGSFEELYSGIVEELLREAERGPLVYAVPGHPLFAEATVRELLPRAREQQVPVRIVAGVSFLDVAASELGIDPVDTNLQLVDALDLAAAVEREPFAGGSLPISPLHPALIAQIYSQPVASNTKLALLSLYPPDTPVTVMIATGTAAAVVEERPLRELDHGRADHLTTVFLPAVDPLVWSRTGEGLQQIVARLRAPGGCPWDREQTHESLVRYLIEESYEAVEALERADPVGMEEELGDVLLQVYLHAQIAEEAGDFSLGDVYQTLAAKLVRRHPHVFGDVTATTPGEVIQTWDAVKSAEKQANGQSAEQPGGRFGDVPLALPALARAQTIYHRAARSGRGGGWPVNPADEFDEEALAHDLARLVAAADAAGLDAEQVLRRWTQLFERSDPGM